MKNILLLFYIIINVFLYVLNFELFSTSTSVDLGFTTITLMPIMLMMIIGFIFVLLFYWMETSNENNANVIIDKLNDQLKLNEKDMEIILLKHSNEIKKVIPIYDKNEITDNNQ